MKISLSLLTLVCMSYLNMHGRITINDELQFTAFNSFTIEESVNETSDSATIILARNYKELNGMPVKSKILPGMPVLVECGYDDDLVQEFKGFIKPGISAADFPLTIELDELYPLRQNNFILSYRNISLKDLLHHIAPGYKIESIDTNLGKISFNNKSTYQILQQIKKEYGFYSRVYDNTLHVGFAFDFSPSFTQRHDYTIGKNVRDFKSLKYETDRSFNTRVEVHVRQSNGKMKVYKWGVDGDNATVKKETASFMDEQTAMAKAKALYHQATYDGYTGNIKGFGVPRVHAGDSIRIINPVLTEREGTYLTEKVRISYQDAEIERDCTISFKLA